MSTNHCALFNYSLDHLSIQGPHWRKRPPGVHSAPALHPCKTPVQEYLRRAIVDRLRRKNHTKVPKNVSNSIVFRELQKSFGNRGVVVPDQISFGRAEPCSPFDGVASNVEATKTTSLGPTAEVEHGSQRVVGRSEDVVASFSTTYVISNRGAIASIIAVDERQVVF